MKRNIIIICVFAAMNLFADDFIVGVGAEREMAESFVLDSNVSVYELQGEASLLDGGAANVKLVVNLYDANGVRVSGANNAVEKIEIAEFELAESVAFSRLIALGGRGAAGVKVAVIIQSGDGASVKIESVQLLPRNDIDPESAKASSAVLSSKVKAARRGASRGNVAGAENFAYINGVNIFADSSASEFFEMVPDLRGKSRVGAAGAAESLLKKYTYYVNADTGNDSHSGEQPIRYLSKGPKRSFSAALNSAINGDGNVNEIVLQASQKSYSASFVKPKSGEVLIIRASGTAIIKGE